MGFLDAPRTLFLGDGARHNWELQQTHFPGAIPILDYYHAAEHLADYCKLLPATLRDAVERSLSTMMWEGGALISGHRRTPIRGDHSRPACWSAVSPDKLPVSALRYSD